MPTTPPKLGRTAAAPERRTMLARSHPRRRRRATRNALSLRRHAAAVRDRIIRRGRCADWDGQRRVFSAQGRGRAARDGACAPSAGRGAARLLEGLLEVLLVCTPLFVYRGGRAHPAAAPHMSLDLRSATSSGRRPTSFRIPLHLMLFLKARHMRRRRRCPASLEVPETVRGPDRSFIDRRRAAWDMFGRREVALSDLTPLSFLYGYGVSDDSWYATRM